MLCWYSLISVLESEWLESLFELEELDEREEREDAEELVFVPWEGERLEGLSDWESELT